MDNHGDFVGSLGNVCRYLGRQAEALGVEIYPGFPAAEMLTGDNGEVVGIATGDMGVAEDGEPKAEFTRGMELRAKYTILAEGARGSLTKQTIQRYELNQDSDHQKYGLGVKELWQVRPEEFRPGLVQHSMGWPLPNKAGGGSWLYHFDDHLVSVGFVVHLNYENPTLSPFEEFQRFKTHPMIRDVFEGAKRIGYGARAIMEGGWQSVPRLSFPGRLPGRRLGRVRERAAHQGQPQRHPVGHALRRARVRGAASRARQRRGVVLRGVVALLTYRLRPQACAQRQAAVVEVRHARRHRRSAAWTCG